MIPRPEHPKPQFQRDSWMNLNGTWSFEIDHSMSGKPRGFSKEDATLSGSILVPFCPESKLSGVEFKDFMAAVWYQRKVELTEAQCAGRVFLHFGAVDYLAEVFVNGNPVGNHKGGYVSFKFEITDFVRPGENVITLYAKDDTRDPLIPTGKQCEAYASHGCYYTRTTGIWQTVWLEFTPKAYIKSVHYETNIQKGEVYLTAQLEGCGDFAAVASYEGRPMGSVKAANVCGQLRLTLSLSEIHLWEPGAGRLYDLQLTFCEDRVQSYVGLRSIRLDGFKFLINEKSVFQRLVLDQGFYPDGVYTAPSDAALEGDIDLSLAMGFNGARLHEKIFEERFLYHCDRKGYLVWGEYPNWGLHHERPDAIYGILPEWLEELERDRNHPAIIGWCPFNETWDQKGHRQFDDLLRMIYRVTKAVDPSRPCIDTSGNYHVETDIYDVHDYDQNPVTFKEHYDAIMETGELYERFANRQKYTGGPCFISEYGGIRFYGTLSDCNDRQVSWGYGDTPDSEEAFKARFKGLADAQLDNHCFFGLCYTQLTDVEQEQNGLYTYERQPKFDPAWVHSVLSRKAAIED